MIPCLVHEAFIDKTDAQVIFYVLEIVSVTCLRNDPQNEAT
jgi:hypothetical protein